MAANQTMFGRRAAMVGASGAASISWHVERVQGKEQKLPARKMDTRLASELLQSVYSATVDEGIMEAKDFQEKRFRLQRQEWPYYRQAFRNEFPEQLEELSGSDGGIAYPVYFNFLSYVQWKAVADSLEDRESKRMFVRSVGKNTWESCKSDINWKEKNMRKALANVLDFFVQGGYIDDYEIAWDNLQASVPTLEQQWTGGSDVDSSVGALPSAFQVRLKNPADIVSSVALRAEEDGFWQRCVSSVLGAFLEERGLGSAVDEYIFQDQWTGPRTLGGKVLLYFGDPLQQVDVPFQPNAILQEWRTCSSNSENPCQFEKWQKSGFFLYGTTA
eukprot:scaffold1052_cov339-Pavlova_lutheri.AAC.59